MINFSSKKAKSNFSKVIVVLIVLAMVLSALTPLFY